jgi:NAD(P)-dependent dehydrogenase (short-subunit alcohol dehydrogenase family)
VDARFDGQAVFITGAARGMGRSHALAFAAEGADLVLSDIGAPEMVAALAETAVECEERGATVLREAVDVRDLDGMVAFAGRALEAFGKLDVLVANAGIFMPGRLVDLKPEEFAKVMDVNVTGTWNTIKAVVPSMAERGYGRVVLIGSTASLEGGPGTGGYSTSKHAVLGLTRNLALDHGGDGVTVNCVCPSVTETKMMDSDTAYELVSPDDPTREATIEIFQSLHPVGRPWLEPEEVSRVVLFLAAEESKGITGAEYKVDLGLTL